MHMSRRSLAGCLGSALALGGWNGKAFAASGWRQMAPIPEGANEMIGSATAGKVYIYGGLNGAEFHALGLFFSFDPASNSWTSLPSSPIHLHHAAPVAAGNKFFMFGGFDFSHLPGKPVGWLPVASASAFDTVSGKWESLPDMPTARGAAAAVIVGSQIHVIGGAAEVHPEQGLGLQFNSPVVQSTAHEIYDLNNGTWSKAAPVPTGRNHHGAALIDGKIYVVGGRVGFFGGTFSNLGSHEVFDTATGEWAMRPQLPTPRSGIGVVALNGRLHVLGGEGFAAEFGGTFRTHEIFDPDQQTWQVGLRMPTPRHGFGCAVLDNRIYAVSGTNVPGGNGPYVSLNNTEVYEEG